MSRYYWPKGSLRQDGSEVRLTQEVAGWSYSALRVVELSAPLSFATGAEEFAVLPLAGGLDVEVEGRRFTLEGRHDVFSRVTDWAYLPIDAEVKLSSPSRARVALASARARHRFDAVRMDAESVTVEIRGAGPSTRQVNNFMSPEVFSGADRLMCVELLTPDGNWSSYPPHKHDASPECSVNNEEIYYFEIGELQGSGSASDGFAMYRGYASDGSLDQNLAIGDGDVVCVPFGYHGPCIAAPGYPLYYLNVLAGSGAERSLAFCDDPSHHWVRDSWTKQDVDPRCPMTSAKGRIA